MNAANAIVRSIVVFGLCALLIGCESGKRAQDPGTSGEVTYGRAWRQLRVGMDPVEVLDLLNNPAHVEIARLRTTWYYSDARGENAPRVVFDTRSARVERWHSPK